MRGLAIMLFVLALPAGATTVNVTDPQFGAVGDLRTCADMQMTSGSATLYSPSQCNFISADVGKWVQVPFAGDSYGTGLSAQISGFTDSQHVTLSVEAVATANGGTAGTIGTGNYAALGLVATYACAHSGTTVNWPTGSYYIEAYKITGGGSANGITDITWTGCSGTINTGSASIVSNGSYRQLDDASGSSYEATVSPFHVVNSTMTISGLEINGSVEETTSAGGSENQSYGIVTAGSSVTLTNLNVHSFPTDSVILGMNSLDTSDVMTNVQAHNSGRMGLTVANVAGLTATNFQGSAIGTGFVGQYIGHPPEDCVDVEPSIAPKASGIVFTGGSLSDCVGNLFAVTPEGATSVTITGMTWTCSMPTVTCSNGGSGELAAGTTIFSGNTFNGTTSSPFVCGGSPLDPNWTASYITHNTINLTAIFQLVCGAPAATTLVVPIVFENNTVTVSGTVTPEGGPMYFDYATQVCGNNFFVSKNAQVLSTENVVEYTGARFVCNNTYSTDLTNASHSYAALYTGVNLVCGEVSQEPTYFVVTGGNAPCPSTTIGNGSTIGSGTKLNTQ